MNEASARLDMLQMIVSVLLKAADERTREGVRERLLSLEANAHSIYVGDEADLNRRLAADMLEFLGLRSAEADAA
ncbi:hypothetical protein [Muricoccus radiodurans]|uniref:hypothetical protein n=1 Tax=Muricoccus radiodurans TaxID=2231721 RepID=UPI003CEFBBE4